MGNPPPSSNSFHGINFKSKSWALFSLRDPSISFVSDAQEIFEDVQGG